MKTLYLLVFSLLTVCANAQKITGIITNIETGEPVPYANIMLVGKNFHTGSDFKGSFEINSSKECDTCTILISSIGYGKNYVKLVKKNLQEMNKKSMAIYLTPKVYQISEVVVYSRRPIIARINSIKIRVE